MTVSSPKTEHYEGRAYRVVPIFADLRPYLEDAYELAEPGEVFVVGGKQGEKYRKAAQGKNGWVGCNLRTSFEKIVRRANLTQWPRLFHNMRASCETDLMQEHGIHVVTAWLGNTPKVALATICKPSTGTSKRPSVAAGKVGQNPGHEMSNWGKTRGSPQPPGKTPKRPKRRKALSM